MEKSNRVSVSWGTGHPHFLGLYKLKYIRITTVKFTPKVMAALVLRTLWRPCQGQKDNFDFKGRTLKNDYWFLSVHGVVKKVEQTNKKAVPAIEMQI